MCVRRDIKVGTTKKKIAAGQAPQQSSKSLSFLYYTCYSFTTCVTATPSVKMIFTP